MMRLVFLCALTILGLHLSTQAHTAVVKEEPKEWGTVIEGLTEDNLKAVTIKQMYSNYKNYRGDGTNNPFEFDVIHRFLKFKDTLVYSDRELEIRDWNNERLFSTLTLKDGKEVYVHMAWGFVSAEDVARTGLKLPADKERLREAGIRATTKKQAVDRITFMKEDGWEWHFKMVEDADKNVRTLSKMMKEKSFQELNDDSIAFYSFLTGYLTVDGKEKMYFVMNGDRGQMAKTFIDQPLIEYKEKQKNK